MNMLKNGGSIAVKQLVVNIAFSFKLLIVKKFDVLNGVWWWNGNKSSRNDRLPQLLALLVNYDLIFSEIGPVFLYLSIVKMSDKGGFNYFAFVLVH